MKKLQAILALILAAALLCMLFAACAASDGGSAPQGGTSTGTAEPGKDTGSNTGTDEPPGSEEPEVTEIIFYLAEATGCSEFSEHVIEAMNELTIREIGVSVDWHYVSFGSYGTEANMALVGGERIDVMMLLPIDPLKYASMYSNNQLMEIGGLLAEYAPNALELVGSEIDAYKHGGGTYGIPTHRDLANNTYIVMRKGLLEELNLLEQAKAMQSWSDYEAICETVKQNADMYPMAYGLEGGFSSGGSIYGEAFADTVIYDTLGSSYLYTDSEGNVSNFFQADGVVDMLERYADWAEKGWFWPDSALASEIGDAVMKQGAGFSQVVGSELTVETAKSNEWGEPVVAVKVCPSIVKTGSLLSWGMVIPVNAEEPEAACKFINMLYTSPELMNLYVWGVEGTDYDLTGDNEAKPREQGAYWTADFMIGNQFLAYPGAGSGGDARKLAQQATDAAPLSAYLGFSPDSSMLDNEMAALSAVMDQYSRNLRCGGYNEALYAEFLQKLNAAGIDSYIAEYQKQLDAWLAEN